MLKFGSVDLESEDLAGLQIARQVMLKTYALIHDPVRHTTGASARRDNGLECGPSDSDAVMFCLVGGLNKICWADDTIGYREQISIPLFDQCAIEMIGPELEDVKDLRPSAYANDHYGHEAALKIIRCSMAKVRAELKRRQGN